MVDEGLPEGLGVDAGQLDPDKHAGGRGAILGHVTQVLVERGDAVVALLAVQPLDGKKVRLEACLAPHVQHAIQDRLAQTARLQRRNLSKDQKCTSAMEFKKGATEEKNTKTNRIEENKKGDTQIKYLMQQTHTKSNNTTQALPGCAR